MSFAVEQRQWWALLVWLQEEIIAGLVGDSESIYFLNNSFPFWLLLFLFPPSLLLLVITAHSSPSSSITRISQLFPCLANLAHHLFSFTLDGRKEKKRYKIFYVHAMLCISSYVPFTKITGHGSSDQFITSRWLSGFKKEERKRERN